MGSNVLNEVKEFAKKEFKKPDAYFKGSLDNHVKFVVKHALELSRGKDVDGEVVEIAAWLHDIGSAMGRYEDHHIFGADVAAELLRSLDYPSDKIEIVKHCILSHRGSLALKRETCEAQILADADAMSHFDNIDGITERVFDGDKKKTLAKLERSYSKLSDKVKPLVVEKLEQARRELG